MPARLALACLLTSVALACDSPPVGPPAEPPPVDVEQPWVAPVTPLPVRFQFVRLHAPAGSGAQTVRIGVEDRVGTIGMQIDARGAPSRAALSRLEALCVDPEVTRRLRSAAGLTPSTTMVELSCGGVSGVLACDAGAVCGPTFDAAREILDAAWDEVLPVPKRGITLGGDGAPSAFVVDDKGRQRSLSVLRTVKAGAVAIVCAAPDACVRATAPEHVQIDAAADVPRLRCPSCAPVMDVAMVTIAAVSVMGSLGKEHVQRVVEAQTPRILACYADELAHSRGLKGKVAMRWVVNADGRVTQAQLADSTMDNEGVALCLAGAIRTWRFAKPKGGGIAIVTSVFAFTPGN